jgi:hypothetical protein
MRTALLFTLTAALFGHDLYLRPRLFRFTPGQAGTVEFHNGEAFPESQVPPVLARLQGTKVLFPNGQQPLTGVRIVGQAGFGDFKAPAAPAFLVVGHTIPNFIELDPKKFEEYLAHERLTAASEWRKAHGESAKPGRELYSKYVKTVLHTGAPDAFVTRPTGAKIEFVPLADPATKKPGDKLTVQILFNGAPAPNLHVEAASASGKNVKETPIGRTNSQGQIDIPLDSPGLWKLHAIHMQRRADTKQADWESHWASLTFEVTK